MNARHLRVLVAVLALTGFSGCGSGGSGDKDADERSPVFRDSLDRLSSKEQTKIIVKEFLDLAKKNQSKSCPRPVLRGQPLPGTATGDIIAVVEPAGEDDPCVAALSKERMAKLSNSYFDFDAFSQNGFPPRRLGTVRPLRDSIAKREPIEDLLKACAPSMERIGKAVSHKNACSPYLPGVRRVDYSSKKYLRLDALVATSAIETTRKGETQNAVVSLLDLIRFGQDFHRGGTSILEPAIAIAGVCRRVVPVLEWLLNRREPLGAPLLTLIDQELAALIATSPHPSKYLEGETVDLAVYTALPMLFGPQWSPPGEVVGESEDPLPFAPSAAQTLLMTIHKTRLGYTLSCRPEDTAAECFSNMKVTSDDAGDSYKADMKNPFRWLEWIRDPPKARPNEENPIYVTYLSLRAFRNYVKKNGQTSFYLGALRLLTKYREVAEETSSCPGIEIFGSPAFEQARVDPYSGKPLQIREVGDGRFVIRSSEKLEFGDKPEDAIAIHVMCPYIRDTKTPDGGP